jgi:hypothetical protein
MKRWLLVTFAIAVGCGDEDRETVMLAELSSRRLVAGVNSRSQSNPSSGVDLRYANPRPDLLDDGCPVLDPEELHAALGAAPLQFGMFGFWENGLSGENYCYMTFVAPLIDPVDGVVVITDRSLEIVGTFEQTALEPRSASHPTWSFARGEMVTVRWSHPSDLIGAGAFAEVGLAIGAPQFSVMIVPPDKISFVVPSEHPVGPVEAFVGVSRPWDDIALSCENASSCRAAQVRNYTHQVNVY